MTDRDQALLAAIKPGLTDDVGVLLAAGASPDASDVPYAALHLAVCCKRWTIVRLLLDAGARTDVHSVYHSRTPLMYAACDAKSDGVACTRLLIERGANVRAVDFEDWTAMHFAASHDNVEAITMLYLAGAEIDARSKTGRTPLSAAAGELACSAVEKLLAFDADPNIADENGWTPLHAAIGALVDHRNDGVPSATAIMDALLSAGASPAAATNCALPLDETELPSGSTPADLALRLPIRKPSREKLAKRLHR